MNDKDIEKLLEQLSKMNSKENVKNNVYKILNDCSGETNSELYIPEELKKVSASIAEINILRQELAKLDLNLTERLYYDTEVFPLLNSLHILGFASENYASSARNIAQTNFGKSSKIKDALDLVYDVNDLSDEVLKALKCKLRIMINIGKKYK
ncbi:hypothetical protein CLTEP_09080 [Clostridium tepidiprofundi DSM 19306]|uniref:Uncharacterized protein n=1 Tax=Clostridium tepidiprofundi DSM 19306 TaxID=1121338 RepID=A0A151B5A3_9CLOT|nr:hypothetical protein [Clostridium tepidiprofundi]KYH35088.1 hypothetical protein CLTEP_09080 [Clostridium tepidiprofundi DSM 19306]